MKQYYICSLQSSRHIIGNRHLCVEETFVLCLQHLTLEPSYLAIHWLFHHLSFEVVGQAGVNPMISKPIVHSF